MNAEKTRHFAHKGRVKDKVTVEDNAARLGAVRLAAEVAGVITPRAGGEGTGKPVAIIVLPVWSGPMQLTGDVDPRRHRCMDHTKEAIHATQNPANLKYLDRASEVRVVDLEQILGRWRRRAAIKFALREAPDPVDSPSALLHRRRRPGDSVVYDLPTEGMEILAFLQDVRRCKYQREAGHPELTHKTLVDRARHPPHWNLLLQRRRVDGRQLVQRCIGHVWEVH